MKVYGLIGYPLTHSFSKKYFSQKFVEENITDCIYENFEIPDISDIKQIIKNNPDLKGLNVTIPYKEQVLPYLSSLDESAEFVGAVNVIKINKDLTLTGYNSDFYGFKQSLLKFLPEEILNYKALILGTGGAAKAVEGASKTLKISYSYVSRNKAGALNYSELTSGILHDYRIIVNTTPLGMYPKIDSCPEIPYNYLTKDHYLFDLVYNPEITLFMKKGAEKGAFVKNGLEMLYLQAEKAWEIWNS